MAGRERRATAGNRLSTLLNREADDDELELLFAEDEEDIEFEAKDAEDEADVQLETSEDDDAEDDPAGAGGDDNLEGEVELQREAKAQRQAQKRKAQETLFGPSASRKRVKVDPTKTTTTTATPVTPAPRPKRRSERATWLPSAEAAATRQSSRKATVQNKEVIHARMKEHEQRRLQQIASMDVAAAKRKAKLQSTAMTQEDRLAEARKVERLNSKSLNRWEATERKRAAEEKARLAALHDRRLTGPTITWWSGMAEWTDGRLKHVGKRTNIQEAREGEEKQNRDGRQERTGPPEPRQPVDHADPRMDSSPVVVSSTAVDVPRPPPDPSRHAPSSGAGRSPSEQQQAQQPSIPRPHEREQTPMRHLPFRPSSSSPAESHRAPEYSTRNLVILENFDSNTASSSHGSRDADLPGRVFFNKRRNVKPQSTSTLYHPLLSYFPFSHFCPSPHTHYRPSLLRRCIVQSSLSRPPTQTHLLTIPTTEAIPEPCVITAQPARFRDPSTLLPYRDMQAFKEIQKLKANMSIWSGLLGCYVGTTAAASLTVSGTGPSATASATAATGTGMGSIKSVMLAARGVPERFCLSYGPPGEAYEGVGEGVIGKVEPVDDD